MEQQPSRHNRPNTFASSFRRIFQRSSSTRSRSSNLGLENRNNNNNNSSSKQHKTSSRSSSTLTRWNKSSKDTKNLDPDFALKSTTLPSPIRPPLPSTAAAGHSPSPPHSSSKLHQYSNIPSPTARARQHTHLPVTIMKSPKSAPPINPHYTLPRQPPPLRQTASSWDISPTALLPQTFRKTVPLEKPKTTKPLMSPHHHFGTATVSPLNGLPISNSVTDINYHTYSEPYHWLAPTFTGTPTTVSSRSVLELPPPPLPPRPHQVHPEGKSYNCCSPTSSGGGNLLAAHDYMSISTLTLNPKPDVSDYQQPIVTQTTPLPSCIKHRQQTIRDEIQKESSPENDKEDEDKREKDQITKQEKVQQRKIESNTLFHYQPFQCRADTKRTTVVILNDDRTLKV